MYNRFLNNNDYLSIETKEHLDQMTRGNEDRYAQAEMSAEMSMLEYLSENFEIEKALELGKSIRQYNKQITYPVNAVFYLDGKIYKAIKQIQGNIRPTLTVYWIEYIPQIDDGIDYDNVDEYRQLNTYQPNDIVKFAGTIWQCQEANGYEFGNIRLPGVNGWSEVEAYNWEAVVDYALWEVVSYKGKFYTLMNKELYDSTINPVDSDNWGEIGEYSEDYNIYEFSEHEYVVYKDCVLYPTMEVNASTLEEGTNIYLSDPRNQNIKKHMLQLAIYELCKLVSPNNVSSVRITDYETSIQWLRDASRLKLNPQIPRKLDEDDGKEIMDWAVATYAKDYNPNENIWQI